VLSRSSVELNLGLGAFLLLLGIILDSLPPRDVIVSLELALEVVIVIQVLTITHVLVNPGESLVLMVDCD